MAERTSLLTELENDIGHGSYNADVQDDGNPEHDAERHLLGFVAELTLAENRTRPPTQERQQMKGSFGNSTPSSGGSSLVRAVCKEGGETHHENDRHVDGDGEIHGFSFAKVIAAELAVECHEVLSQSIKNAGDLNAVLLAAKEKDVVFLDESHELPKQQQTALYLALDQRKIVLTGSGRTPTSIPIAQFTLLLATTDEFSLLQPLRDRMKLVLRFQFYSVEELTILVKQRSQALRWNVDEEVLMLIAERSRGIPRLGLRLLQSCRRVCRSEGKLKITQDHLERACQLEGIDALGLGPVEQQYLMILSERDTRLNVIASRLGLPARTVSQVTEPFLLRAGLISKDDL